MRGPTTPRHGSVKLLLIEGSWRTAADLKVRLQANGFDVMHVDDGDKALRRAAENHPDVIVLGITASGPDSYEILRQLRERRINTPVMVLAADDGKRDEAAALELGADDYLSTPFSFVVFIARLQALVRRGRPARPPVLRVDDLVLDPARHVVSRAGVPIDLSPREFGLLQYLMRNPDTVCSKMNILHSVWDDEYSGPCNVVEVYVGYVRRKIDTPFGTHTIETVRGAGYRLQSQRQPSRRDWSCASRPPAGADAGRSLRDLTVQN